MKPKTTIQEQIQILKSRGCTIDNEEFAEKVLSHINYYRFTAYFLPYRSNDGTSYIQEIKFTTMEVTQYI